MSFRGKPLIVGKRPWWRHHIFQWGWYSLSQDRLPIREQLEADGHYFPGDGGGGSWSWSWPINVPDDGGRPP